MKSEFKRFLRGFGYAANGIRLAVARERNFRFHLCAAAYVIWFAARFYRFNGVRWAILAICIGGVLALELLNSAVERAVGDPDARHDALAGAAKDLAAGAVLAFAAATVAVAFALFWKPGQLTEIVFYFAQHPGRFALLCASVAAAARFVFGYGSKG